jgi:hypothetical protein
MSLLGLFDKKERAALRKIVETDIPEYKSTEFDHVNKTVPILEALRSDPNPIPYRTFIDASQDRPKFAVRATVGKGFEGSTNPTLILIGGMSFNPEYRVLLNTISGEQGGEKVEQVREETYGTILEFTSEFQEARYKQEKGIPNDQEPSQESEPKSIF